MQCSSQIEMMHKFLLLQELIVGFNDEVFINTL